MNLAGSYTMNTEMNIVSMPREQAVKAGVEWLRSIIVGKSAANVGKANGTSVRAYLFSALKGPEPVRAIEQYDRDVKADCEAQGIILNLKSSTYATTVSEAKRIGKHPLFAQIIGQSESFNAALKLVKEADAKAEVSRLQESLSAVLADGDRRAELIKREAQGIAGGTFAMIKGTAERYGVTIEELVAATIRELYECDKSHAAGEGE